MPFLSICMLNYGACDILMFCCDICLCYPYVLLMFYYLIILLFCYSLAPLPYLYPRLTVVVLKVIYPNIPY
jgi:hypothetical protein